jgi:hypothetical protein
MDFLIDWWSQLMPRLHELKSRAQEDVLFQALVFVGILIAFEFYSARLKRHVASMKQNVDDLRQGVADLRQNVDDLGQTMGQKIADVRNTAEQRPVGPSSPADAESWEQIRNLWSDARDRMEITIGDIADDRVRRKYSRYSRSDYADIISSLQQDGLISADVATALKAMNEKFLALKRARAARPEGAGEFQQLHSVADKALPKLPDE